MMKPNLFVPLWHFLNQPVFDERSPLILDPRRFWYFYRVRYLERCLCKNFQPEERFRNQG
ncbi:MULTISPECIES: hypothetical protein [unclassified Leptolyngbya]|uniref:hypothetical protein n=1 Tax=unclassified Leptolyngbya TaxID=2650499 RepID=UPI0016849A94|nr:MULTISPECIES: hypothetical protein [unclassified Leptolyngbya]MBD1911154.1 hypothetical protein [Leptolyngbya sp. FACHB-8]MBD2154353.1 hypothetical protein [Leptolyngbya sp. FACHB-16]